jgi:putative transposase
VVLNLVFSSFNNLILLVQILFSYFYKKHIEAMKEIFRVVCEAQNAELTEFNGESDHVHLLVNFPPHLELSKLINSLKGVSSRQLRKEFPKLEKRYWGGALWSRSYFAASCGGAPLEIIKQYVEQQRTPN